MTVGSRFLENDFSSMQPTSETSFFLFHWVDRCSAAVLSHKTGKEAYPIANAKMTNYKVQMLDEVSSPQFPTF